MSSYSQRLEAHLKNRAQRIKKTSQLSHGHALDQAAIDFGFSGWKQATSHMVWADGQVAEALVSLSDLVQRRAEELRLQAGYPHVLEDRTGINYEPGSKTQRQDLAERLVMLDLFDSVNAPLEHRCQSAAAQLWFRPVLDYEDAVRHAQDGQWALRRHSVSISRNKPEESASSTDVAAAGDHELPSPGLVYLDLLSTLHGFYSLSILRVLAGKPEDVLSHPCFKEFFRHAVVAWRKRGSDYPLDHLLEYVAASVGDLPRESQVDPANLIWIGVHELEGRMREGVSMLAGIPNHPRLRRPVNPLGENEHSQVAQCLRQLQLFASGKKNLHGRIYKLLQELAQWMGAETGSPEVAEKCYLVGGPRYLPFRFLAPAQEVDVRALLARVDQAIRMGYEDCSPKRKLLAQVSKIDGLFESWMARTAGHWLKVDRKLLMNSSGLVAVDVSEEPSFEPGSPWKPVQLMGTSREAELIEVLRPHLFEVWREEDLAEDVSFDPADPDAEQSLLEHLENLSFFRYVGQARTSRQFLIEVREAFFFQPVHVWFKQRLIEMR
ncbi:hypothetical protein [Pseudomonas tumuqii]|uniref:hypothetical protein n=1 Tax=Pseudomonas tumuqii TaxID=2715755 RepID=UPI001557C765|nr:hypothetical protein [Pseudomonas tumuqii]